MNTAGDIPTSNQKLLIFVNANMAENYPQGLQKNIHWFLIYKCWNAVLNCGQWLCSLLA